LCERKNKNGVYSNLATGIGGVEERQRIGPCRRKGKINKRNGGKLIDPPHVTFRVKLKNPALGKKERVGGKQGTGRGEVHESCRKGLVGTRMSGEGSVKHSRSSLPDNQSNH